MNLGLKSKQSVAAENSIFNLSLCCARPTIDDVRNKNMIVTIEKCIQKKENTDEKWKKDGFCSGSKDSSIYNILTYFYDQQNVINCREKSRLSGKLLEIAIREVNLKEINQARSVLEIASIAILFGNIVICKTRSPFNRKLHKLLLLNQSSNFNDLSIKIIAQGGTFSVLPFPVPKMGEQNKNIEIQFGINDKFGNVYSGILICTISSTIHGQHVQIEPTSYDCSTSNDPNDPKKSILYLRPNNEIGNKASYFLLEHSALKLAETFKVEKMSKKYESMLSEVSVSEHNLPMLDLRTVFQRDRSLDASSVQEASRNHTGRKPILSITVLRGVEVPVREESATVQPLVEIELGDTLRSTTPAEGPAPVWHQTVQFTVFRLSDQQYVTIRLFDQHPIWGLQWLGECKVPIECQGEYEELERWISLSPLQSPAILLGYVQASPGHSLTRIYVLMKMKHMGVARDVDLITMDKLSKKIQRCLSVPHKIPEINDPEEVAQLTMLLSPLSEYYGPLTPRQALNLGQVDYYGRAVLLANLLQGLGQHSYVILGASQTRKWAAFALTVDEDADSTIIWDPENGGYCELGESHSPLIKTFRLVNHQNVWENTQKSVTPVALKYNPKINKDWQPLGRNIHSEDRAIRTLELSDTHLKEKANFMGEIEQHLENKLSQLRKDLGFPTVFNRHATLILQDFLLRIDVEANMELDKKGLRQLYRAYYTHGFILKLRHMNLKDLSKLVLATKIHSTMGPVEFGLACRIQHHIGNIHSIWLALVALKSRK